jgi:hypothetical protein
MTPGASASTQEPPSGQQPGLDALAAAHDSVAAASLALSNASSAVEWMVTPGLRSPTIVRRLHDEMEECAEGLLKLQVLLAAVLYAASEVRRG